MKSGCLKGALTLLMVVLPAALHGQEAKAPPVDGLMADLADPDFKTRQQAQKELEQWGKKNLLSSIEKFYRAYEQHEDPEVRTRARAILKELVIFKQAGEGKGYLGIRMQADELMMADGQLRPVVRVTEVMEGTPAQKAGLLAQDLILGVNDFKVRHGDALEAFGQYVQNCKPRTDVTLHLLRNGEEKKIDVNLMRRPPDLEQRTFLWGGEEYVPPSQDEMEEKEFQEWLLEQRRGRSRTD